MRRLSALIGLLAALAGCALVPAGEGGPSPIGGTWKATEVAGRPPVVLSEPRLQFTEDGRVQGTTGCNDFEGQVRFDGAALDVTDLVSTRIGCPADVAATEAAFLRALDAAERLSVDGETLVLSGPDGELRFTRRLG